MCSSYRLRNLCIYVMLEIIDYRNDRAQPELHPDEGDMPMILPAAVVCGSPPVVLFPVPKWLEGARKLCYKEEAAETGQ